MRTAARLLPLSLLLACAPDAGEESAVALTAPLFEVRTEHFGTHATGAEEVPSNGSLAQGQATFRLSEDGETLHYKLIVANIENILQSHIHRAPKGTNGGIVVWLYNHDTRAVDPIPGRFQGILAEGEITSDDLVNAMAGGELSDLIAEIRAGNAYVNVHTSQFPPGEIRGQIR